MIDSDIILKSEFRLNSLNSLKRWQLHPIYIL